MGEKGVGENEGLGKGAEGRKGVEHVSVVSTKNGVLSNHQQHLRLFSRWVMGSGWAYSVHGFMTGVEQTTPTFVTVERCLSLRDWCVRRASQHGMSGSNETAGRMGSPRKQLLPAVVVYAP